MPTDIHIRTPSAPFRKAFLKNVQQDKFNDIYLLAVPPPGFPTADGFFSVGQDGTFTPQRILLSPYCQGLPGEAFWMRLYGWRSIAGIRVNEPTVWVYYLLAEFLCVAGSIPGPIRTQKNDPGPEGFNLPLGPTDKMCSSLAMTAGVLGATGFINSMPPGSIMPACAGVELQGVQLVSFDFAQAPSDGLGSTLAANCLFTFI